MRPRQLLGFCIVGLAGVYLLELLYHGILSAVYPYDLNYGEGYVLNDALRLVRGEQIWGDLQRFPMVRSAYPPLYLVMTGLLASPSPSFVGPRLVSLAATLAVAGLLAVHGWRMARPSRAPWIPAALAAGLWVGSTFVYQWAPLARVDLLGLAFSLAAVLLVERAASSTRLLLAIVLCSCALLTKQTFLAAPLAIATYLALRRDARALWFAGGVLALVGAITLGLNATTGGEYAQHVLFGNSANPFRLDRTFEMAGLFLRINAIAGVVALAAVGLHWSRLAPSAVGVYIPFAFATLLSVGNVSSDVNYFLEPTVALALSVPRVWRAVEARWKIVPFAPMLAVAQLVLLVHIPNGFMANYPPGPAKGSTPVEEDVRVGDRVEALVRSAGPGALVELAGFAVLAGAPVWIQPIDLQAEQRRGRWTPELLNASIIEQRWSTVVLSYKFLPAESLAALASAYEQTDGLASPNGFSYFVYRPRPG